jgi:sec-independent protein translocase protein TatA
MGAFSIWHLLIVLMVILVVFGAGRLPSVMGDMAKGVKAFKKGMADEEPAATANKDKEIPNHS